MQEGVILIVLKIKHTNGRIGGLAFHIWNFVKEDLMQVIVRAAA
jgi:hypothetical protein